MNVANKGFKDSGQSESKSLTAVYMHEKLNREISLEET